MNAFGYGKCWSFGKMVKEKFPEYTELLHIPHFMEWKKLHAITDNQLFYIRRGFMGRPFEDDTESADPLDNQLFPFGTYKGQPFKSLAPKYLLWLAKQEWLNQWPDVALYVKRWKSEQEATQLSKEEIADALRLT